MTTVQMPRDRDGTTRTYTIRWNWSGAGKHRVHVLIDYKSKSPSTYVYPAVTGKAARAVWLARHPEQAKQIGVIIIP